MNRNSVIYFCMFLFLVLASDALAQKVDPDIRSQLKLECNWNNRFFSGSPIEQLCSSMRLPPTVNMGSLGEVTLNFWNLLNYISVKSWSREEERAISDAVDSLLAAEYLDGFWSTFPDSVYSDAEFDMRPLKGFGAKQYPMPNAQTFSPRNESESNWLQDWREEILPTEVIQVSLKGVPVQKWQCVWGNRGCEGLTGYSTYFYLNLNGSEGSPFWASEGAPDAPVVRFASGSSWKTLQEISWNQRRDIGLYTDNPHNHYTEITYPPATSANSKLVYTGLWARRDILEQLTGNRIYDGDIIEVVASVGSLVLGPYGIGSATGIVLTDVQSFSSVEPQNCVDIIEGFCVVEQNGRKFMKVKIGGRVYDQP